MNADSCIVSADKSLKDKREILMIYMACPVAGMHRAIYIAAVYKNKSGSCAE